MLSKSFNGLNVLGISTSSNETVTGKLTLASREFWHISLAKFSYKSFPLNVDIPLLLKLFAEECERKIIS